MSLSDRLGMSYHFAGGTIFSWSPNVEQNYKGGNIHDQVVWNLHLVA